MINRILLLAFLSLGLSACAFGDAELALGFNPEEAKAGLLSEAGSATLYLADVADEREDKQRVGYKRNGYGMKTADILSEKPAPEVVKEALAKVLENNGHVLGDEDERYGLETTLNTFWFDMKAGFVSVEFFGSVQAEVSLVDHASGEAIYREVFDGYHSEKTGGGLSGTWERIMNEALADFANKVNLSPGLMEALSGIAGEQETGAEASAEDLNS